MHRVFFAFGLSKHAYLGKYLSLSGTYMLILMLFSQFDTEVVHAE